MKLTKVLKKLNFMENNFEVFTRVKIKLPDGSFLRGTVIDLNDAKPGDIDLSILWDSPLNNLFISEIHLHEAEILNEKLDFNQLEEAKKIRKALKKFQSKYEKSFKEDGNARHEQQSEITDEFNKEVGELMSKASITLAVLDVNKWRAYWWTPGAQEGREFDLKEDAEKWLIDTVKGSNVQTEILAPGQKAPSKKAAQSPEIKINLEDVNVKDGDIIIKPREMPELDEGVTLKKEKEKKKKPLSEKEAATYDAQEMEDVYDKQWAERGLNPATGPFRDWVEDSRTFPKSPNLPRHQQELWWFRQKEQDEKDQIGGETDRPGATPGFWHQSPTTFEAMPMSNTISITIEFMKNGLKGTCTWDKDDLPPGLNEEQTLAKIIEFLEKNVPQALASFKNVTAENIDLVNRIITLRTL